MKRVIVTGASGFVGRPCCALLSAAGYEVHAISSRNADDSSLPVVWHAVNLLDSPDLSSLFHAVRPTHLLHLAWQTNPGTFWTSEDNLRWVQASVALATAFRDSGGRRLVAAGSCAEYDWTHGYCSEAVTPLAPATLYGTCKHALQQILDAFARQTEISFSWGRVFHLYGPHEHPAKLVASVIRSLLASDTARCSQGTQIRDFLHVEDAARAFVMLLDSDVAGAVNIASGIPVTVGHVVRKIAAILGRDDLVSFGAYTGSNTEPRFLVADVHRLRTGVKWFPRYDLDDGLQRTITWWREQSAGR